MLWPRIMSHPVEDRRWSTWYCTKPNPWIDQLDHVLVFGIKTTWLNKKRKENFSWEKKRVTDAPNPAFLLTVRTFWPFCHVRPICPLLVQHLCTQVCNFSQATVTPTCCPLVDQWVYYMVWHSTGLDDRHFLYHLDVGSFRCRYQYNCI